jgi:hypothetical protein
MVSIIALCAACQPEVDGDEALVLIEPLPLWQGDDLKVMAGVAWTPSPAVIEALDHGVVVPLKVTTRVSRHHRFFAIEDRDRNHRFEIRYLPLVRSYQLTELKTGQQSTYPRLAMLTESLRQRQVWDTGLNRAEADQRDWQVEIRAELDRSRLPSPMRMPVWFDSQWRAVTPWHGWAVHAEPDHGG